MMVNKDQRRVTLMSTDLYLYKFNEILVLILDYEIILEMNDFNSTRFLNINFKQN